MARPYLWNRAICSALSLTLSPWTAVKSPEKTALAVLGRLPGPFSRIEIALGRSSLPASIGLLGEQGLGRVGLVSSAEARPTIRVGVRLVQAGGDIHGFLPRVEHKDTGRHHFGVPGRVVTARLTGTDRGRVSNPIWT